MATRKSLLGVVLIASFNFATGPLALAEDAKAFTTPVDAAEFATTWAMHCLRRAAPTPWAVGLSQGDLERYCACSAVSIVENLTVSEFRAGFNAPAVVEKLKDFNQSCFEALKEKPSQ
jgi:hypothetical protein